MLFEGDMKRYGPLVDGRPALDGLVQSSHGKLQRGHGTGPIGRAQINEATTSSGGAVHAACLVLKLTSLSKAFHRRLEKRACVRMGGVLILGGECVGIEFHRGA